MNRVLTQFLTIWMLVFPVAIPVVAGYALKHTLTHRWLVHILMVLAMLSQWPLYIGAMALPDPTTLERANLGEGFLLMLHLALIPGALIYYAIYAWQLRRASHSAI